METRWISTNLKKRRGLALALGLACLAVLTLIAGALLGMARLGRAASALEGRRIQAEWLARAGVERAAARLVGNADWSGETWTVPAEALDGFDAAEVRIDVTRDSEREGRRHVVARAEMAPGTTRQVRSTQTQIIDLGRIGPQSGEAMP